MDDPEKPEFLVLAVFTTGLPHGAPSAKCMDFRDFEIFCRSHIGKTTRTNPINGRFMNSIRVPIDQMTVSDVFGGP